MKPVFPVLAGAMCVAACAYPQSSIQQGLATSSITITDAPKGASILVDGRAVGERTAAAFDSFVVEPGTHVVEERFEGRVLLRKPYSIDAGASVEIRETR